MILRRFLFGAALAAALLACVVGRASADAASYIRSLFEATFDGADPDCRSFMPVAHFAGGQHWRQFDTGQRAAFDRAFCDLALESLSRLRQLYPGLTLHLAGSHPGPNQTFWVRSRVTAGGQEWPVDWLVDESGATPHVADLKVLGISLAIFLRSLAADAEAGQPDAVLRPWRRALNLALPE